jgi:hypothetical protein
MSVAAEKDSKPSRRCRRWTSDEAEIVRLHFPGGGASAVAELLHGRSTAAVQVMASKLGVRWREPRPGAPPRKRESKFVRGVCVVCEVRPQYPASYGRYKAVCRQCYNDRYGINDTLRRSKMRTGRSGYEYKGSICEQCGFVPIHSCQLDVDHKDGDRKNGARENIQTLCANCHRLKTWENQDSPEWPHHRRT